MDKNSDVKLQVDCQESALNFVDCAFYGVYVEPASLLQRFWRITCPCGVVVEYPINMLPVADTPHPCGRPNHWTVKLGLPDPAKE